MLVIWKEELLAVLLEESEVSLEQAFLIQRVLEVTMEKLLVLTMVVLIQWHQI